MSRKNLPGNIFIGATLVGKHDGGIAGAVYDTSDQLVGKYAAGDVWVGETPGPGNNGSYNDGVIYGRFGEQGGAVGYYKDGRILDTESREVGKYTGGDGGAAAGGFLLVLTGS